MRVLSIWREHLKTDNIGINDNFFDLGGHSLLLTLINHALRRETGLDISMVEMFQYPTVYLLAEHLGRNKSMNTTSETLSERAKKQQEAVLKMKRKN
jgi:polyketide synthase PksJ